MYTYSHNAKLNLITKLPEKTNALALTANISNVSERQKLKQTEINL